MEQRVQLAIDYPLFAILALIGVAFCIRGVAVITDRTLWTKTYLRWFGSEYLFQEVGAMAVLCGVCGISAGIVLSAFLFDPIEGWELVPTVLLSSLGMIGGWSGFAGFVNWDWEVRHPRKYGEIVYANGTWAKVGQPKPYESKFSDVDRHYAATMRYIRALENGETPPPLPDEITKGDFREVFDFLRRRGHIGQKTDFDSLWADIEDHLQNN